MWDDIFKYDPSSPSCIMSIPLNKNVGSIETNKKTGIKYWRVCYKKKLYLAHRVVYEVLNGEIPTGMIVDHIDGDSLNNTISNLRITTRAKNNRNASLRSDNTTGICGVWLDTRDGIDHYFVTSWYQNGYRKIKRFSIKKLGYEEARISAVKCRETKIEELNSAGMGYTTQHGKQRKDK